MATKKKTPTFFKGDFGFMITFTTKADLESATDFLIRIVKPAVNNVRTVVERELTDSAILDPTPGKGIVGYIVQAGDLDLKGSYLIQLADVTSGRHVSTPESKFSVVETVERFDTE